MNEAVYLIARKLRARPEQVEEILSLLSVTPEQIEQYIRHVSEEAKTVALARLEAAVRDAEKYASAEEISDMITRSKDLRDAETE